jgi:hypothetical protein
MSNLIVVTEDHTVPAWYLAPLVTGDVTGLTDAEEAEVTEFEQDIIINATAIGATSWAWSLPEDSDPDDQEVKVGVNYIMPVAVYNVPLCTVDGRKLVYADAVDIIHTILGAVCAPMVVGTTLVFKGPYRGQAALERVAITLRTPYAALKYKGKELSIGNPSDPLGVCAEFVTLEDA